MRSQAFMAFLREIPGKVNIAGFDFTFSVRTGYISMAHLKPFQNRRRI